MFAVKIAEERQGLLQQLFTQNAFFVLACARINANWKLGEKCENMQPMTIVIYNSDAIKTYTFLGSSNHMQWLACL